MKILITGAKGMLGQDLCPILEDEGFDVIETDIENLDVTNEQDVLNYLYDTKLDYVIHCAAYTNVEQAETEKDLTEKININGTANIAKACSLINGIMIYISSDYVFDGKKDSPYTSDDLTNPINHYGYTKLQGEEEVKKYCEKYYIVRTSWLYGIHGNNFVEKMISKKEQNELKVVNDQTGSPTWTVELANGIVELIDEKIDYGTYNICGSGSTTWYNFAKTIFEFSGIKVNLIPCNSSDYKQTAIRPKYSVLKPSVYTRKWEDALSDYLELRTLMDEGNINSEDEAFV